MTPCVEHNQKGNQRGYGHTKHKQITIHLHRLAFCQANNLDIYDIQGLVIRHKCDNPRCINPEHLISGTQKENVMDMMSRGRHKPLRGSENSQAVLNQDQVRKIKEAYIPHSRTNGTRALARKYGVSCQHISKIVNGKKWSHLDGKNE